MSFVPTVEVGRDCLTYMEGGTHRTKDDITRWCYSILNDHSASSFLSFITESDTHGWNENALPPKNISNECQDFPIYFSIFNISSTEYP
jgi:hypothetical protein